MGTEAVYGRRPSQIAASIQMLLDHEELTLQEPDVVTAALEHYRKRPTLEFSDCLVLELTRKGGHVPLGTFDRDLAGLPDVALVGR